MELEMLDQEVATAEDYVLDGEKRHENSILVNVPNELREKGALAVTLLMNFLSNEIISDYTGKNTYMNIEESYIMSGVYPKQHLEKVYKKFKKTVTMRQRGLEWEEDIIKYEIIDQRENLRIRSEAIRYWNDNGLQSFFTQLVDEKFGNIPLKQLITFKIFDKALSENENDGKYLKMSMDILGLKKEKAATTVINIKSRGGGEAIKTISKVAPGGFLKETDDEDDDEW